MSSLVDDFELFQKQIAARVEVIAAARQVRADLNGDEAHWRVYDGRRFVVPAGATIRGTTLLRLQEALDALDSLGP